MIFHYLNDVEQLFKYLFMSLSLKNIFFRMTNTNACIEIDLGRQTQIKTFFITEYNYDIE